jgi:hypothetical protein
MHIVFLWKSQKEDLDVGRIIFKRNRMEVWIGFLWLRKETTGGLLSTQY